MPNILQDIGTKVGGEFKAHRLRIEALEGATETLTGLALVGNNLQYTDESGTVNSIDLSPYLDDTNLSRIVSGTTDGANLTLTRDDATTVVIDVNAIVSAAVAAASTSAASTYLPLTGKAADSDKLDGLDSSQFLRSGVFDIQTAGGLNLTNNIGTSSPNWTAGDFQLSLECSDAGYVGINFHRGGYTSNNLYHNGTAFIFDDDVQVNSNTIWHAGNDGSGSGLDADLLDGVQGSNYARTDIAETFGSSVTATSFIGDGSQLTNLPNATSSSVGGIKARLSGSDLYITFDGTNA